MIINNYYALKFMHIMELLKAEMHCHNIFSNGHVGSLEPIHDCNVTISQQLEQAYLTGLDVLFVTNHNTIDGYRQMLEYKKNYSKFDTLNVYPAASLLNYTNNANRIILIDPKAEEERSIEVIKEKATSAVPKLVEELLQ